MTIKAFFHPKGRNQSEFHSEYEISMDGVNLVSVYNGTRFMGAQIKVTEEKRPIFIVASSRDEAYNAIIWKFHYHTPGYLRDVNERNNIPRVIEGEPLLSSRAGFMIHPIYREDILRAAVARRNNVVYIATDIEYEHSIGEHNQKLIGEEPVHFISFEDMLAVASGSMDWEDLKHRGIIIERDGKRTFRVKKRFS